MKINSIHIKLGQSDLVIGKSITAGYFSATLDGNIAKGTEHPTEFQPNKDNCARIADDIIKGVQEKVTDVALSDGDKNLIRQVIANLF